ncbi:MAG: hypothetical protein WKF37_12085 [Bryobacteraceae bacterium]
MALFTDGLIAALDDLKAYESSVLDTASTEGINVEAKLGLAQREISFEIGAFLMRHGVHLSADQKLDKVVVTEPLLHWHCLHTLELIYRDAYNSQLNDRHQGKWREYTHLSRRTMDLVLNVGIGINSDPLPKSKAPTVTSTLGGSLVPATLYFATAWAARSGATGRSSDPSTITLLTGELAQVLSDTNSPLNATGWFLYAGESAAEMKRQNETPLPMGSTWVDSGTGLRTELSSIPEQGPDYYVKHRREWLRG